MMATKNFDCDGCNKTFKSQSGLTLHKKKCSMVNEPQPEIPQDEVGDMDIDTRPQRNTKRKAPLDIGAFAIFGDHLPILLDVDLAVEVGKHILEHGSENSAVMAFGHQLMNYAGGAEE